MLIMSKNYAYLINAFPEAGGAFTYARELFGYDHGFLVSWFLALTYLAMLWANATSIPLFARYFLGDILSFGKLYKIFDYDVYLGGVLVTCAVILLFALLCARWKKTSAVLMLIMVILFTAGIILCFAGAFLGHKGSFDPVYIPDVSAARQVIGIACISPWAFIGFENVSHVVEETTFQRTKMFRVLVASVLISTLLYACVTLLSVTAYPPEYASWLEYINDLGNLSGIKGLPAFYAANVYMGKNGVTILMVSLLCLVFTSLIGNITALSRLFFALGKDGILLERFGRLDASGAPANAIWLIAAISMVIPLLGRTAIVWIVDVTTLGATIVYGFVSSCACKLASGRQDRTEIRTGLAGLGFIYFRRILRLDHNKRFGQSIIIIRPSISGEF